MLDLFYFLFRYLWYFIAVLFSRIKGWAFKRRTFLLYRCCGLDMWASIGTVGINCLQLPCVIPFEFHDLEILLVTGLRICVAWFLYKWVLSFVEWDKNTIEVFMRNVTIWIPVVCQSPWPLEILSWSSNLEILSIFMALFSQGRWECHSLFLYCSEYAKLKSWSLCEPSLGVNKVLIFYLFIIIIILLHMW